jgi:hypothetical protein
MLFYIGSGSASRMTWGCSVFLSQSEREFLQSPEYLSWLESEAPGFASERRRRLRDVNRDKPPRVVVEAQGHVLKARVAGRKPPTPPDADECKRGRVFGLSYASRKRLLEKFARFTPQAVKGHRNVAVFLTLTYPGAEEELPTPQDAKAHLRAFLERIRRRYPEASGVWRLEFDSEGVRDYHPHFHLILFRLPFIDKRVIQRWWRSVIGCEWARPFTRVEAVRSWRGVMSYASKYVCSEAGGLDHDAYPHAGIDSETGEIVGDVAVESGRVHTGRVWGVFNRGELPYAELREYVMSVGDWFFDLKRSARCKWEGVNGYGWAGFTLFVEEPDQWVELARFYAWREPDSVAEVRQCVA